jgi:hypothetical protein
MERIPSEKVKKFIVKTLYAVSLESSPHNTNLLFLRLF